MSDLIARILAIEEDQEINIGRRERQTLSDAISEIEFLRSELAGAVRDINRIGSHSASPEHCAICELVKTYGFDPEELRSEIDAKVGAGGAAE